MANKTVTLNSYLFNGRTGLTMLLLHPSTGAVGNGAGDALTPGSNGQFSAVVTEAITGAWRIVVTEGSVSLIEDEWVYFPSDVEGTYPASGMRLDIFNAIGDVETPVYVYPLAIGQEQRNTHQEITVYTSETGSQYFYAVDSNDTALDLTGLSLEFRVGDNKTKNILYTASTADSTLTVTLTNKVTFTKSTKFTRFANSDVSYSLRNMSAGGEVLLDGPIRLKWAP